MAADSYAVVDPATTYKLDEFIDLKDVDTVTYRNLSILEKYNGVEFVDHCLVDEYLDILIGISKKCELTAEEMDKYRYSPDLLAYDVYGSTQMDFLVLAVNEMSDPKEFDRDIILLPYASKMKLFVQDILSLNKELIDDNRELQDIDT